MRLEIKASKASFQKPDRIKRDTKLLKRDEHELRFAKTRNPLPTVEIDLDSLPEGSHGYGDLVSTILAPIVAADVAKEATLYVFHGPSINFGEPTWSAFFGLAGNIGLLETLLYGFKAAGITRSRMSDHIDASSGLREFHIQEGYVWRQLEQWVWYASGPDEKTVTQPAVEPGRTGEQEELVDEPWEALTEEDPYGESDPLSSDAISSADSRNTKPRRYNAARSDASVGTIKRKIEELFGLPEGSVALCGPDKARLRSDATIATLRKRWGE